MPTPSIPQDARTACDLAVRLWRAADDLGRTVGLVERMGNESHPAIASEADAADRIVIEGPEVARALRALAMRLDRAVMVRCTAEE